MSLPGKHYNFVLHSHIVPGKYQMIEQCAEELPQNPGDDIA